MYRKILYENIDKLIRTNKLDDKRIYAFGKNYPAFLTKDYLSEHGYELSAFLDNNSKGGSVEGIPVIHPSELSGTDIVVLITSEHFDDMCRQLEGMGYIRDDQIFRLVDITSDSEDRQRVLKECHDNYQVLNDEEIKKESLKILKYIKKVCDGNAIPYYLCAGTLLGAVRHQGFIPWDDDIDVTVPVTHCEKLKDIIRKEGKYVIFSQKDSELLKWNYFKICDPEIGDIPLGFGDRMTHGLSIDIFPLYSLPDDPEEYDRVVKENERLKNLIRYEYNHQVGKHGKEYLETRKKLVELWDDIGLTETKRVMRTCIEVPGYNKEDFASAAAYKDTIMMKFCDDVFPAPAGYDEILTNLYGDYMELPPEEKRCSHHTSVYYYR